MLIQLMYHRVTRPDLADARQRFADHLKHLSSHYDIVRPGEKSGSRRPAICLVFDDAYYDFYAIVYPLLCQYQIPAVLAIPTDLILETTSIGAAARLAVPDDQAMAQALCTASLCTWQEIREMVASGWVVPASHSASHVHLDQPGVDLSAEIVGSAQTLAAKTGQQINTFVYPYGRFTPAIHAMVLAHYQYALRIGSALNWGWKRQPSLYYRVDADKLWPRQCGFHWHDYLRWSCRNISNTLRRK